MKPELNNQLITKHEKIFVGGRLRTFECGPGWFSIIDDMATKLQAHIDASGCPQVQADQFKEKFGEVRFYYSGGDATCKEIVAEAVAKSNETCDFCGEPGEMQREGWMRVRCETHKNSRWGDLG